MDKMYQVPKGKELLMQDVPKGKELLLKAAAFVTSILVLTHIDNFEGRTTPSFTPTRTIFILWFVVYTCRRCYRCYCVYYCRKEHLKNKSEISKVWRTWA